MGVCLCGIWKVWVYVCVGFVICECFGNCGRVVVTCVLVFAVFLYCFVYVYLLLLVTSVRTIATE